MIFWHLGKILMFFTTREHMSLDEPHLFIQQIQNVPSMYNSFISWSLSAIYVELFKLYNCLSSSVLLMNHNESWVRFVYFVYLSLITHNGANKEGNPIWGGIMIVLTFLPIWGRKSWSVHRNEEQTFAFATIAKSGSGNWRKLKPHLNCSNSLRSVVGGSSCRLHVSCASAPSSLR